MSFKASTTTSTANMTPEKWNISMKMLALELACVVVQNNVVFIILWCIVAYVVAGCRGQGVVGNSGVRGKPAMIHFSTIRYVSQYSCHT